MAKEKVTFEVKQFVDEDGFLSRGIFVDGRHFDWGIDSASYEEAMNMGPEYHKVIQADIEKHFLESLSEFMNRRVTAIEVNEATKTGLIDK